MLFREQLIKYHLIRYLLGQPITLGNINQRTFINTCFLITKWKNSPSLFGKSTAKCARNLNSNCKWHEKKNACSALAVSNLMNPAGKWGWQSPVSSMGGGVVCCRVWRFGLPSSLTFVRFEFSGTRSGRTAGCAKLWSDSNPKILL